MVEMDTGEQLQIGAFKPQEKKKETLDMTELFEKMQIAVVGKENKDEGSDLEDEEDDSSDEVGDIDEELAHMEHDPN